MRHEYRAALVGAAIDMTMQSTVACPDACLGSRQATALPSRDRQSGRLTSVQQHQLDFGSDDGGHGVPHRTEVVWIWDAWQELSFQESPRHRRYFQYNPGEVGRYALNEICFGGFCGAL